jgi:hypothetical protein
MANEIVKMVAKKANISEPIAQIAVDTVLNVLKSKLPASIGGTLESLLGSGTSSKSSSKKSDNPLGDLGNIAGALGGLLGKKK